MHVPTSTYNVMKYKTKEIVHNHFLVEQKHPRLAWLRNEGPWKIKRELAQRQDGKTKKKN